MHWDRLDREACSVVRTLSIIGDRGTLLVLREAFLRVRRFEEFGAQPRHHPVTSSTPG